MSSVNQCAELHNLTLHTQVCQELECCPVLWFQSLCCLTDSLAQCSDITGKLLECGEGWRGGGGGSRIWEFMQGFTLSKLKREGRKDRAEVRKGLIFSFPGASWEI